MKIKLFILLLFTTFYLKGQVSQCDECYYKLYPTQNNYTFLKLDSRNGKIWQVQWAIKTAERFEIPLNTTELVYLSDYQNDRFELYPTVNMYNFILLDKINGTTWQVQWSNNKDSRFVYKISK